MRVFLSWSGEQSRQVADLFKNWIPHVLQSADVYMSAQDISAGERWLQNVSNSLAEHDFGFTILTQRNLTAPWILFEAGAVSKSLKTGRLVPILCGIEEIPVLNPLSQFQYIKADDKAKLFMAISAVNALSERPLTETRLRGSFEKWYPDFISDYNKIDLSSTDVPSAPSLTNDDIGSLMVNMVREMKAIRLDLENQKNRDRIVQALVDPPRRGLGLGLGVPESFNSFRGGLLSGLLNPSEELNVQDVPQDASKEQ